MSYELEQKISAMFDEFPFLEFYYRPENVGGVRVKRWDENILNLIGQTWYREYSSELSEIEILLLDENRQIVASVGKQERKKLVWWKPSTWLHLDNAEHVYETITRIGEKTSLVTLIVRAEKNTGKGEVIVYKPPNGYNNLGEWFRDYAEKVSELAKTEALEAKAS